jgi:hypothetical protein
MRTPLGLIAGDRRSARDDATCPPALAAQRSIITFNGTGAFPCNRTPSPRHRKSVTSPEKRKEVF